MIKEIFLPEMIGTHRILSQRIAGIALHETSVTIALVNAKPSKTVIESLKEEQIEPGPDETLHDRTVQALRKIITAVPSYQSIRACIPASIVIFKELQLQFSDPEKIRMVLDYEIETMLPFSINEAIVDFIITKPLTDQQTAQVFVAAVRSQDLQTHLQIYQDAGIDPATITIDLFALYGLYQQIPEYRDIAHATALIEYGAHTTRIAFLQQGQLRLMRYLPRGYETIIKQISEEALTSTDDINKKINEKGIQGIGDEALARVVQKHFVLLFNEIQFTLNSFTLKLGIYEAVHKIFFTGSIHMPHFMTYCSDTLQIPCEIFDCQKLFLNGKIKNNVREKIASWDTFATALGAAIPSQEQSHFNLRRKQFAFQQRNLIIKQTITASILVLMIFLTIGIWGYLDISALTSRSNKFESDIIGRLRAENIFIETPFPQNPTLASVVNQAARIVENKKETWLPLMQKPMHPLELWLEITRIINKKQFDVTIKEVTFTTQEKGWERDESDAIKRDIGIPKVEIEGLFRSKTGSHFTAFDTTFANRFTESALLKLVEPMEPVPTPDANGVNFSAKLKLKEV